MNYNVQNVLFQIYTKRCNIELVFGSISKTKKIAHLVFVEYMMPTSSRFFGRVSCLPRLIKGGEKNCLVHVLISNASIVFFFAVPLPFNISYKGFLLYIEVICPRRAKHFRGTF